MALPGFYRGDTVTYKVTISDANGPINLTSPAAVLTLTLKSDTVDLDTDALIKVTDNQSHGSSDPAQGVSVFELASVSSTPGVSQDGTDIPVGSYFYDIQYSVTGSPPIVKTTESGKVSVSQDVTLIAT